MDIQERIENSLASLLELLKGVFSTCKGDLLEVTDGNVKTQPAVLENLVFFVEVCLPPAEGLALSPRLRSRVWALHLQLVTDGLRH